MDDETLEGGSGYKLVLVSSRLKNATSVISAAHSDVICILYQFDTCTTESLLGIIEETINGRMFTALGLVMHSQGGGLVICGGKEKEQILTSSKVIAGDNEEWQLITTVIRKYLTANARLDIIATSLLRHNEGAVLLDAMNKAITIQVHMWPSFCEDDNGKINQMYFNKEKLGSESLSFRLFQPSLAAFEKIRTVGKGAYGTAVLYRKKDDESLVILKEINMHDLNYNERQLALNEVKVLGMLHHPNIIAYYDSFEEDGTLIIEMEYADGGTLAQYLSTQDADIPEFKILYMFRQMLEACKYLHDHNILHRDLKTVNIFLTKNETVKLGDFGISKVIATKAGAASTVLGTPYYISPEMCEGKPYDAKSDVWALGCVLYEMACREKAFDGSNLPALVNKIIKGEFKPVSSAYSSHFRDIVSMLLTKSPDDRPTADTVLNQVQGLVQFYTHRERKSGDQSREIVRSVIYILDTSLLTLCPIDLPLSCVVKSVSLGESHIIATTELHSTYTWGKGTSGQLGHGNRSSLYNPTSVDGLEGKYVISAGCGDDFSFFVTDNGLLLSCGAVASKCLGHADVVEDVLKPKLCEAMLSTDVTSVTCGPQHVAVTTKSGVAFTWGCGASGRLGHGNEKDQMFPAPVNFREDIISVRKIRCGLDGTMFLTDDDTLFACGSNRYNKLGLNKRKGFLLAIKTMLYNTDEETEVSRVTTPEPVKIIGNKRCIDLSLGPTHSAIIVDTGQIYTFGLNKDGQLGSESKTSNDGLILVKSMENHRSKYVGCCRGYTATVTDRDSIYVWGQPPPTNLDELALRGVQFSDSEDSEMDMQMPVVKDKVVSRDSHVITDKKVYSAGDPMAVQPPQDHKNVILSADGVNQFNHTPRRFSYHKSHSNPDICGSADKSSAKSVAKSSRIRKTVSERNSLEHTDLRVSPIEISLTDAARRASASGHPGQNQIRKLISYNNLLLIQVQTTAPQKRKRQPTGRYNQASSEENLASSERSESAFYQEEGHGPFTPEKSSRTLDGTLTDDTRTWLKLELENGVTVQSKLREEEHSSNVTSGKSKDSGIDTSTRRDGQQEYPETDVQINNRNKNNKRRLRRKINAAVNQIETTDSEDEFALPGSKAEVYKYMLARNSGNPYREKLNWKEVRGNKASELRATSRNPSNISHFKLKSPYNPRTSAASGHFSRELESVQEKAELLQEQLTKLEKHHKKQSKELQEFKNSKVYLESMFSEKWACLEREKKETELELQKYRTLLAAERCSAAQVQDQLENEVRLLQTQLESQKNQLENQVHVVDELKDVISTIQKQNTDRSKICSVQ